MKQAFQLMRLLSRCVLLQTQVLDHLYENRTESIADEARLCSKIQQQQCLIPAYHTGQVKLVLYNTLLPIAHKDDQSSWLQAGRHSRPVV